jgi:hypothetical protein
MTAHVVPHSPLDILPVPANTVFCKVCNTIHITRAQLCPAHRLDMCALHKKVFLPHEKSVYQNSTLQDVDTECPDCFYGSEKKFDKALTRSNSRALRPAAAHKDMVFCVYCWGTATKKCTHLATCREHSCVYLKSQIDINSRWWLRPSDFGCHLCPLNGIMPKKAQEWEKKSSTRPASNLFSKEWEQWKSHFESQITRLNPGAFQSWEARCEYVTWMNEIGKNEMLFLRYLAYEGVYPVTIIYAETGTVPRTVRCIQSSQPTQVEPPPPYASPSTSKDVQQMPSTPQSESSVHPAMYYTSVPSHIPTTPAEHMRRAMPATATPVATTATAVGPGRQLIGYGMPGNLYQQVQSPRQPHIHPEFRKPPLQNWITLWVNSILSLQRRRKRKPIIVQCNLKHLKDTHTNIPWLNPLSLG